MLIITRDEFDTMPIDYMRKIFYNRLRHEFAKVFGNSDMADRFLLSHSKYTLRQLSCNSMVDVMSCFVII